MTQTTYDISQQLLNDPDASNTADPLLAYAVHTFPDVNDRMRFMAMLMFASVSKELDADEKNTIASVPEAIADVAKDIMTKTSLDATVH